LPSRLASIEEARTKILAEAEPLPVESFPLAQSLDMVLAEDLVTQHDLPPFANSAMDGYAVHSSDTGSASAQSPAVLKIVGTIAAGHVSSLSVGRGEAMRIMTGAPMPEGADAVAQVEITSESSEEVLVKEVVGEGANVREAGGDVSAGATVVRAGTVLRPAEIGMAASLGLAEVPVHRRPRVAVVSTGSELVEAGGPLGPGQIYNSNGSALRALCQQIGIEPDLLGIATDDRNVTKELLSRGLDYDVLLTSGGVSVGAFDFVKEVEEELGVQRLLWGVAMKPGKPLVVGKRGRTLAFGLPGNPVSTMVSFELFVRPTLLRLMGYTNTGRPRQKAMISEDLPALKERTHVMRVRVWREGAVWRATSTGDQGSGRISSMLGANGLVFVPAASPGFKAGSEVEVTMISEPLEES